VSKNSLKICCRGVGLQFPAINYSELLLFY